MADPHHELTPRLRAGGKLIAGDLYVQRAADRRVHAALASGGVVVVLGGRQTGKSSLLERARKALQSSERIFVWISLEGATTASSEEQFFATLIHETTRAFARDEAQRARQWAKDNAALAPAVRWGAVVEQLVRAAPERAVIFLLDELDSVLRLPGRQAHEFWVQCRRIYQELAPQVAMAFAGVLEPDLLRTDKDVTPFNIGERVNLDDLPREDFDPRWIASLSPHPAKLLDEVYAWTSGHPYLTQRLLIEKQRSPDDSVEAIVQRTLFDDVSSDHCLRAINGFFDRTTSERADDSIDDRLGARLDEREIAQMLAIYRRVRSGEEVAFDTSDRAVLRMRLTGLLIDREAASRGRRLVQRNRVFERVFDEAWIEHKLSLLHRPLLDQTLRWIEGGRRTEDLLRGAALDDAERRVADSTDVTEDERQFAAASRREANLQEARRRRSALLVTGAIVVASVGGTGTSLWFYARERAAAKEASEQSFVAQRERSVAEQRRAEADDAGIAARAAAAEARAAEARAREQRDLAERRRAEADDAGIAARAAEATASRLAQQQLVATRQAERSADAAVYASASAQRSALLAESQALRPLVTGSELRPDLVRRAANVVRDYNQIEHDSVSAEDRGLVLASLSSLVRAAWDTPIRRSVGRIANLDPRADTVLLSGNGDEAAVLRISRESTSVEPNRLSRWSQLDAVRPSVAEFAGGVPARAQWAPDGDVLFVGTKDAKLFRWDRQRAPTLVAERCNVFQVADRDRVLCIERTENRARWCNGAGACWPVDAPPALRWSSSAAIGVRPASFDVWPLVPTQPQHLTVSATRVWGTAAVQASTEDLQRLAAILVISAVPSQRGNDPPQWLGVGNDGDVIRWRDARPATAALALPQTLDFITTRAAPSPDGRAAMVLSNRGRAALLTFDPARIDETEVRMLDGRDWLEVGWRDGAPVAVDSSGTLHRWERGERWSVDVDQPDIRWAAWGGGASGSDRLATLGADNVLVIRDGRTAARIRTLRLERSLDDAAPVWSPDATLAWTDRSGLRLWRASSAIETVPLTMRTRRLDWTSATVLRLEGDNGEWRSLDVGTHQLGQLQESPCGRPGAPLSPSDARRWYGCVVRDGSLDSGLAMDLYIDSVRLRRFNGTINAVSGVDGGPLWVASPNTTEILRFDAIGPDAAATPLVIAPRGVVQRLAANRGNVAVVSSEGGRARLWLASAGSGAEVRELAAHDDQTIELRWIDGHRLLWATQRRISVLTPDAPNASLTFEAISGVYRTVSVANSGDRMMVIDSRSKANIIALGPEALAAVFAARLR